MTQEFSAEYPASVDAAGPPAQPQLTLGSAAALSADLQRSRDLLRAIFDGIDDGLMLIDCEGKVLAVNQPFLALYGMKAPQLVGASWLALSAVEGRPLPLEQIRASLADGQRRVERVRSPQSDGGLRLLDVQTLPLHQGQQPLGQLVVQVRDVTARVKLEAQMVAAERFSANRHLAAVVAHEVNTPLQAIESCLHMAGKLADAEQRARYLRIAREEIQRVGQILRQLLDLYRPINNELSPVALNELVERSLILVGPSLSQQGVIVERDLAPELPTFLGRADELTQVLLNLIVNALQAMGRGGVLTVQTRCAEIDGVKSLTLSLTDTGPGIAPATLGRVFEPFFTTKPEGNGLGLAVSQRIITAHGGAIGVQSVPGEGATFYVTIPVESFPVAPPGDSLERGVQPENG